METTISIPSELKDEMDKMRKRVVVGTKTITETWEDYFKRMMAGYRG